ncbi:conserved hypothetical protein [Desulfamplus magnetovallimortis]|uniref:7-carboxy-7-deazaguanine synthase n=1 Tax=Desulfamplus magnetovallimortis TaxID=1246637 RepID=A0A1W1H7W3_9BACT|nr:7-carboxy-7-deazaguanine synthase QueE [Desulfamplus magnetovallimortis]SLM28526.1 conserved hypothetical protein [Desulfamplus magnetovallimortis]
MADNILEASEIFHSLQGEGPLAGRPAVFLRLSGCIKPFCPWCDTLYSCHSGSGEKISVENICAKILSYRNDFVVITGGEPFLQWHNGLQILEKSLLDKGCRIQYETSGKVVIPESSKGIKVCSPKYINGSWHFVEDNIKRADFFKFVVSENFRQVKAFVEKHDISREKVWIMPLGACRQEQLALLPSLWEFCVENRFSFSPRLHTLTFDNQRGI